MNFNCQLTFAVIYRYGKIYLKAAKSSLEKGSEYAKKEIQRLERMLEKVCPILHSFSLVRFIFRLSNFTLTAEHRWFLWDWTRLDMLPFVSWLN